MLEVKKLDRVESAAVARKIVPRRLFELAYLDARLPRSDAERAYAQYMRGKAAKRLVVPDVVQKFCDKPLEPCSNPQCPHRDLPARFSRISLTGRTTYFCSQDCMDAVPKDTRTEAQVIAASGEAIFARVSLAMSKAVYVEVSPSDIRPLPGQPRTLFRADHQAALIESLKTVGQMQPGIIRRIRDGGPHKYELLDGERRWRAIQEAGIETYRAMLVTVDDEEAPYVVSVISNFNREEHTLQELALAVKRMHEDLGISIRQIGSILGIHEVEASQIYGLRRLIPEVWDMLDPQLVKTKHPLPKTAAIQIATRPSGEQLELAEKVLRGDMTVMGLKDHIREYAGTDRKPRRLSSLDICKLAISRARAGHASAGALQNLFQDPSIDEALELLTTAERQKLCSDVVNMLRDLRLCAEMLEKQFPDVFTAL